MKYQVIARRYRPRRFDEVVGQELKTQIQEENADFAELAKRHSIDKATKPYGGELGVADRSSLSPAVESAVFSANDGDVVGPIKTDMGYHLIKVHHLLLGKLDKDAAAAIRDDLFTEWLDNQRTTANVQGPLYDVIGTRECRATLGFESIGSSVEPDAIQWDGTSPRPK